MADFLLTAAYAKQLVVRDRNSAALLAWSAYVAGSDIPPSPTDAWIEMRIVAERVPGGVDSIVTQTMAYFQQDPNTLDDLNRLMNPYNSPAVEAELATKAQDAVGAFMSRFAGQTVTADDITRWKAQNGVA